MDAEKLTTAFWQRVLLPREEDADEPELKIEETEHIGFTDIVEDDEEAPIAAATAFLSGGRNLGTCYFTAIEASISGPLDYIDAEPGTHRKRTMPKSSASPRRSRHQ